jgi:hypothetical protein
MYNTVSSNSESSTGVRSKDISKGQLQGRILNVSSHQDFYSVGLSIGFDIQLENYCGKTFKLVHTLTPIKLDSDPITKEDIVVLDKDGNRDWGNSGFTMDMKFGVDNDGIYSTCETIFSSDFPIKRYGIYSYNGKLDLYDVDNNLLSTQGYYLNIKYRHNIFKTDEVKVVKSPKLSFGSKLSLILLQALLVIALCLHLFVLIGSFMEGENKSLFVMSLNFVMLLIIGYFIKAASFKEKIWALVISFIISMSSMAFYGSNRNHDNTNNEEIVSESKM